MTILTRTLPALALLCLTAGCVAASQPDRSANEPGATRAEFDQWMTELSNWGRWGEDDQMGAANLMTDAKRQQAAALVETGKPSRWGMTSPTTSAAIPTGGSGST